MSGLVRCSGRVAILLATLVTGCSGGPVRLGSDIPRGVPLSGGRDISAEACGFQLLYLFPLWVNNNYLPVWSNDRHRRAYVALTAQAGRDLITDVAVREKWDWGLVGTLYCTELKAKAVQARPIPVPVVVPAPPASESAVPAASTTPAVPAPDASPPAAPASAPPVPVPAIAPALPIAAPPLPSVVPPTVLAPLVEPAAAVPAPATAAPTGFAPGAQVRLRADATLRTRSLPDAEAVDGIDRGTTFTLKAVLKKDTGAWWYVTSDQGSGWVLDSGLEAAAP